MWCRWGILIPGCHPAFSSSLSLSHCMCCLCVCVHLGEQASIRVAACPQSSVLHGQGMHFP